jgi:hypothetical protein
LPDDAESLGATSPPWQTVTAGSHVSASASGATATPPAMLANAKIAATPTFLVLMTVPFAPTQTELSGA